MRALFLLFPLAGIAGVAVTAHHKEPPVKAPAKPTYAKDVAPILNRACVSCHRPGEVAPFSLADYDNAKKWGAMAAAVTKTRQMPPWKAAPGYGEFQHENRLSDVEIATLTNWAATGAARGDKKLERPVSPVSPDGWTLGKPDLVLSPKDGYKLDAEGEDVYRNFVIDNPSSEPLWVKAIDVHPGNKKVVHHVIVFVDGLRKGKAVAAANHDGQEGYTSSGGGVGFLPTGALGGWAPGVRPYETPEGTAFRVPAKADLVVQVHYHKSGKPEADKTQVGLYLTKEPVEKEMRLAWLLDPSLSIPAGQKDFPHRREFPMRDDITLHGVMPHMHLLGHTMRARVVAPDGTERPLIYVPDWDFNWQLFYAFKQPMKIEKGSKIVVEATYDNSTGNPHNPSNPPKPVSWGEETTDEMFLLLGAYTVDAERLGK